MKLVFGILFCCFVLSTSTLLEDGREAVEPEYLDYLLREKKYEEFNRLMQIDVPHLSHPRSEDDDTDPRYTHHLEHGDIVLTPRQKEQARQSINFTRHKTYKWENGIVPYVFTSDFSSREKQYIWNCIDQCNKAFNGCVVLVPRDERKHKDYIYFFSGNGCYSNIGRIGGQQPLSLARYGCFSCGTICHEILHALGYHHEQCREDRDEHILIYWENFNDGWKSQFQKVSPKDFMNIGPYDCYSIMHYPQRHPQLVKNGTKAFDVYDPKCNVSLIGTADHLTELDRKKVFYQYCAN